MTAEEEARQAREDLREVMFLKSGAGERFLRRVLEDCGLFTYNTEGNQVIEGRRSIGLDLRYSLFAVDADKAAVIVNQVGIYKEKQDGNGNDDYGF